VYQVYLFCLVLAGGLSLLSVFGDVSDTDFLEGDADVDVDTDVDSGFDWARVLSLRGLLYAVFGFGLAGTLQVWLLGASPSGASTIGVSVVAGLATGWLVDGVVDLIRRSSTPDREGDESFQGCSARVLVPIRDDAPGRIRVARSGRTYDVRALPHGRPESDPTEWERVFVVEMDDGVARVVPAEDVDPGLIA
jgi:hypothetical protein